MRKVAKAIKGTSTHAIDRKLHSHEAVWQEESFDHVLRSSESLDAKIDYVLQNPVRKGLVRIAREYPWSWRKPMDHQDRSRRGGCPQDRKSTRLNSSHANISYAVFCLKKKKKKNNRKII